MKLGKYRHYKGNLYEVLGTAKHTETKEEFVVYRDLSGKYKNKLWVRPRKMFLEKVKVNGKSIPRFIYLNK